jgi:hypothetical protein
MLKLTSSHDDHFTAASFSHALEARLGSGATSGRGILHDPASCSLTEDGSPYEFDADQRALVLGLYEQGYDIDRVATVMRVLIMIEDEDYEVNLAALAARHKRLQKERAEARRSSASGNIAMSERPIQHRRGV